MRQRLLITDGDTYRLRSFGLYRLEEMVRYIRFPIPPLRNLHYDLLFLRTGLSVSEIATQLGFDDVSYFGRVFRKRVGVPPLDYRQSG